MLSTNVRPGFNSSVTPLKSTNKYIADPKKLLAFVNLFCFYSSPRMACNGAHAPSLSSSFLDLFFSFSFFSYFK